MSKGFISYSPAELMALAMGVHGCDDFTDTTKYVAGTTVGYTDLDGWFSPLCITDTVFDIISGTVVEDGDISDTVYKAGTVVPGFFTTIQLTSGAVRAPRIPSDE